MNNYVMLIGKVLEKNKVGDKTTIKMQIDLTTTVEVIIPQQVENLIEGTVGKLLGVAGYLITSESGIEIVARRFTYLESKGDD